MNGSLTILVAASFIRSRLLLSVFSAIAGGLLFVQVVLHAPVDSRYIIDVAGLMIYFLFAVIFSFVLHHLFRKTEKLLKEKQQLTEEKEQLLHEVHHRIKNHMHTITSILSAKSQDFEEPQVVAAFEETKQRIRLMQSIYQKLYTEDSFSYLNLRRFIEELLKELESAYRLTQKIDIEQDIDELNLSSEQAFAVALVVNELVTNAIKYAFPHGKEDSTPERGPIPNQGKTDSAKIRVAVSKGIRESAHKKARDPDKLHTAVVIVVKDNGLGLSQKVLKGDDYGFGLALVEGYVKKFGGEMKTESSGGARIEVSLPVDGYHWSGEWEQALHE
ncbi:MAG: sensor histidine kinase [Spirochaetales bacterium]|nr:sensor histidine kinase [Spirochaetales bacterium]MCF7938168.1 sensor histidine kinase [Spirochaetales bacterium]